MSDGRGGKRENAGRDNKTPQRLSASKARARVQLAKQACDAANIDPFQVLAEIASDRSDPNLCFQAAKELCKYIAPQLKTVQLAPTDGAPVAMITLNMNGQSPVIIDGNTHRDISPDATDTTDASDQPPPMVSVN